MSNTEVVTIDIGTPLKAVLLSGAEVVASDFAAAHGFTRQGVSDLLKRMRGNGWVDSRREKRVTNGTACQIWVWTCIDREALTAYQSKPYVVRRAVQRDNPFEALCAVWNIRVADIDLPTLQHELRGAWE